MKKNHTALNEYLVILSPPSSIKGAVRKRKRKLNTILPIAKRDLHAIPHISLFRFRTETEFTPDLIQDKLLWLNQFPISINGTDFFSDGSNKTLYLRIEDISPIRRLFAMITGVIPKNFTPHITIAHDISPDQFQKVSARINEFDYRDEWICDHLTILRKTDGNDPYEVAYEIPFMGYLLN